MQTIGAAFRAVLAIARVTFFEIIRDKVLYGALVISGALLVLGVLISRMSFIRPDRILLDFGLVALAFSCGFLGILAGAVILVREFDRRTIFIALARPISRLQFLVGKYLGVALVLLLNSAMLSAGFLMVIRLFSPGSELVGQTLIQALVLLAFQSLLLAALALFFSSFSTPSLSIVMSIGLYLVGVNVSQVRILSLALEEGMLRDTLNMAMSLLPNFENFNLGLKVSYGLAVPAEFVLTSISYAVVWIALLLVSAGFFIERKES